jgi:cell division protein ZapA
MAELIPINIVIADRSYRLKINPADEETIRKTVKLINDKIIEFKSNFAGKDLQDYVSMVLLWFATEQKKDDLPLMMLAEQSDKLNAIESLLDKALKSE